MAGVLIHDDAPVAPTRPDPPLTSAELCARTGISYRQLDYWRRAGVVTCHLPPNGSGTRALYLPDEARVLRALAPLHALRSRSCTVPVRTLAAVAALVRADPSPMWIRLHLATVTAVPEPRHDGAVYLSVTA